MQSLRINQISKISYCIESMDLETDDIINLNLADI